MNSYVDEIWLQFFIHLSRHIDSKITCSGDHSSQVAYYAKATAKQFALSEIDIRTTFWASLLHDIGKIGVPEEVLSKNGPLSDNEWQCMKLHPTVGSNILRTVNTMTPISSIVLFHQERYDGSGYPYGLKGTQIPLGSRILAVVDAFDAMTNDRVYRSAYSKPQAMDELVRYSGKQFDPVVVDNFLAILSNDPYPNHRN